MKKQESPGFSRGGASQLQAHLAGRITTTGRPLRRWSVCQLCGLSSGPWLTLQTARISGLMHLASHHPDQTGRRA